MFKTLMAVLCRKKTTYDSCVINASDLTVIDHRMSIFT